MFEGIDGPPQSTAGFLGCMVSVFIHKAQVNPEGQRRAECHIGELRCAVHLVLSEEVESNQELDLYLLQIRMLEQCSLAQS